jgi:hypothetical protein
MAAIETNQRQAMSEGRGRDPDIVVPDMADGTLEVAGQARGGPCDKFIDLDHGEKLQPSGGLDWCGTAFGKPSPADPRGVQGRIEMRLQEPQPRFPRLSSPRPCRRSRL